jgi:AcrR family transcriptional regulator
MSPIEPERRSRDPERSRSAILDAAEALFAENGYEATSLREVGERAGTSRGTPAYFFGSKEGLYDAVLNRAFGRAQELIREAQARASSLGGGPEAMLAELVGSYLDFLSSHPTFIRLVERESLNGGSQLAQNLPHLAAIQSGLEAARSQLPPSEDARQLLLSVMGMCWFPLSQSGTLLPALGLDAQDPAFLAARKRHIVNLVLHGLFPR